MTQALDISHLKMDPRSLNPLEVTDLYETLAQLPRIRSAAISINNNQLIVRGTPSISESFLAVDNFGLNNSLRNKYPDLQLRKKVDELFKADPKFVDDSLNAQGFNRLWNPLRPLFIQLARLSSQLKDLLADVTHNSSPSVGMARTPDPTEEGPSPSPESPVNKVTGLKPVFSVSPFITVVRVRESVANLPNGQQRIFLSERMGTY